MVIILLSLLIFLLGGNDYVITWTTNPKILWWTPLTNEYTATKTCGSRTCVFTDNRSAYHLAEVQAFLFYGSNINSTDFPLPRSNAQIWGLLHEESPKNVPFIQNEIILRHWNYTSTFSRHSDLPLTLNYLKNLEALLTTQYFLKVNEKNKRKYKHKLAPVAYLQSICGTSSGRDEYVRELMEYIDIDSYGACLNNKKLPDSLRKDYLQTLDSDELYNFLAQYKFMIAFENGVCNDYISEKLWRPLIIGSVPIVFGSESVEDWLPNNKSAILIKNFESPQLLADYIKGLDANDTAYNEYLNHKLLGVDGVTNKRLIDKIEEWTQRSEEGIFHDFECYVCEKLHEGETTPKIANGKHYDCGNELVLPKMTTNLNDFYWRDIFKSGQYEAKVLDELLLKNNPFTEEDLKEKMESVMLI